LQFPRVDLAIASGKCGEKLVELVDCLMLVFGCRRRPDSEDRRGDGPERSVRVAFTELL
jgi:hypothetical protein